MLDERKILSEFNELKRNELKKALYNIYVIKEELEKSLIENYSDDTLTKIIEINKMISDAEQLANKKYKDIKDFYAKRYPEYVDNNKNLNKKGIERFINLNKILTKFNFLKK